MPVPLKTRGPRRGQRQRGYREEQSEKPGEIPRLRPAPSLREGSKGARDFAQDDSCEKYVLLRGGDDYWFGGFAPAFHFDFAVGAYCAGYHAGGVEWGGDVALMVEGDYAAFTFLID